MPEHNLNSHHGSVLFCCPIINRKELMINWSTENESCLYCRLAHFSSEILWEFLGFSLLYDCKLNNFVISETRNLRTSPWTYHNQTTGELLKKVIWVSIDYENRMYWWCSFHTKKIHTPQKLSKNMISFMLYTKYKYNLCTKMYTLKIH